MLMGERVKAHRLVGVVGDGHNLELRRQIKLGYGEWAIPI